MSAKYAAGFAFDTTLSLVTLVLKDRPAWQKGRFNAVGGHVIFGEDPLSAMVREFKEETGLTTEATDWRHYAKLVGANDGGWECAWFWSMLPADTLHRVKGVGAEPIYVLTTTSVTGRHIETVSNLPWLLEMALVNARGADSCKFHLITEQLAISEVACFTDEKE